MSWFWYTLKKLDPFLKVFQGCGCKTHMQATITQLKKPNGGMAKSQNEIEGICCTYFKNLYNVDPNLIKIERIRVEFQDLIAHKGCEWTS